MGTLIAPRGTVLRHRNFRLLVMGIGINAFGNGIAPVALAFAVLDLGGSASTLGMVVAGYALAEVVTTLYGGLLGDRVSRPLLVQGGLAAEAVVQALIAISLIGAWGSIPLLSAGAILAGCLSALSRPSSMAMTRETVPESDLPTAVTIRRLTATTSASAGFAGAGMLVTAFGSGWALAIDAATFAAAAYCFRLMRVPARPVTAQLGAALADLREGANEVLRHTWLWLLIVLALVYHLFYGGVQGVIGPIVVGNGLGRAAWGWALGALMAGLVLGGLVSLAWRPRRGLLTGTVFLGLTALFPLSMALSDRLDVILLGALLHGFGLEIFSVNWDLAIQQNIPEDRLSRVYAFDQIGSFVARPLGLALTGPIAQAIGFDTWLIIVGLAIAASMLSALLSTDVRRLERS